MARIYDVKKRTFAPSTVVGMAGVKSFMSWDRLTKLLTEHECRGHEEITHLEIDDEGVTAGQCAWMRR